MTRLMRCVALHTLAAGLVLGISGRARADLTGYATAVGGAVVSVDLTTGTSTVLGNSGISLVEGLALGSNGTLYATDDSGTLYTLSTTTGAVTSTIGSTGLRDVEGLSFFGNQLLGTDYTNGATSLYSINLSTAAPTLVATTNPGVSLAHALTSTGPTTGFFLAGETGSESLYSINTSGVTSDLGAINPNSNFAAALASGPDGTLYSLDSLGYAYTVSDTGNYTEIGYTGSHFYLDLTIAPAAVPEPGSLVLCGIAGVVGLVVARARRRRPA